MARSFNGTSDDAVGTSPAVTGYPLTFSLWVNLPATNANAFIAMLVASTTGQFGNFSIRYHSSDGKFRFRVDSNAEGGSFDAVAGNTISANTWYHICCRAFSATDRRIKVNNGTEVTNTTNCTPNMLDWIVAGAHSEEGNILARGAVRIAEFGLWNVALDDAEVAALANGFSPELVRPASLKHYWDMIGRASPERDARGTSPLTLTGTSAFDHCRIAYRTRSVTGFATPALWTPASLSGVTREFHFDAKSGTPTGAAWNDISGNGRNASQGTAGNRPTFSAAGFNAGYPCLIFDGVNDAMSFSTTYVPFFNLGDDADPFSFAIGASEEAGDGVTTNIANPHVFLLMFRGSTWDLYSDGNAVTTGNSYAFGSSSMTGYALVVVEDDGGSDGQILSSEGASANTLWIGNRPALNRPWNGKIAEICCGAGELSTTDRDKLIGYAAWRWGLQANLPGGHPYASSAPLQSNTYSVSWGLGAGAAAAAAAIETVLAVTTLSVSDLVAAAAARTALATGAVAAAATESGSGLATQRPSSSVAVAAAETAAAVATDRAAGAVSGAANEVAVAAATERAAGAMAVQDAVQAAAAATQRPAGALSAQDGIQGGGGATQRPTGALAVQDALQGAARADEAAAATMPAGAAQAAIAGGVSAAGALMDAAALSGDASEASRPAGTLPAAAGLQSTAQKSMSASSALASAAAAAAAAQRSTQANAGLAQAAQETAAASAARRAGGDLAAGGGATAAAVATERAAGGVAAAADLDFAVVAASVVWSVMAASAISGDTRASKTAAATLGIGAGMTVAINVASRPMAILPGGAVVQTTARIGAAESVGLGARPDVTAAAARTVLANAGLIAAGVLGGIPSLARMARRMAARIWTWRS